MSLWKSSPTGGTRTSFQSLCLLMWNTPGFTMQSSAGLWVQIHLAEGISRGSAQTPVTQRSELESDLWVTRPSPARWGRWPLGHRQTRQQTLQISPQQRLQQVFCLYMLHWCFAIRNINLRLYDFVRYSSSQPYALTKPHLSVWVIQGSLFTFVLSLIPRGLDT